LKEHSQWKDHQKKLYQKWVKIMCSLCLFRIECIIRVMSESIWDYPVESVSSLILVLAGLILVGLIIDQIRKKFGKYPM
jgi:hypothetical protein